MSAANDAKKPYCKEYFGEDGSGDRAKLLNDVHELIMQYVADNDSESAKVIALKSPDEILAAIDLDIGSEARSYDSIVDACKAVLDNSVRC